MSEDSTTDIKLKELEERCNSYERAIEHMVSALCLQIGVDGVNQIMDALLGYKNDKI